MKENIRAVGKNLREKTMRKKNKLQKMLTLRVLKQYQVCNEHTY